MKTKGLFAAVVLLGGIAMSNGQTVQTSTKTGIGTQNGAYVNSSNLTGGTFLGYKAGYGAPGYQYGLRSTFIGYEAGLGNVGNDNVLLGYQAGKSNFDGNQNIMIGSLAGANSQDNSGNIFIGYSAAINNNGIYNTIIGYKAGYSNDLASSNNVLLGYNAGYYETGSNKLYIESSNSTTPLIWGDFSADQLKFNGKVGIGLGTTAFPSTAYGFDVSTYQLIVNGGVLAKEVRVATDWADYVFDKGYTLPTLSEVEQYIETEGHLPNIPSAKEIEKSGIEVGNMTKMQQEKIEELTLYTIAQQKQLEAQQQQLAQQQKEIEELKAAVNALMNK